MFSNRRVDEQIKIDHIGRYVQEMITANSKLAIMNGATVDSEELLTGWNKPMAGQIKLSVDG